MIMSVNMQQRVEQLINGKSYLLIDSAKRQSGTPEQFVFALPNLLSGVKSIRPVYCIISNTTYNVSAVSNVFAIDRSGITTSQGIPVGTYTVNSLISALNTLWNPVDIDF
jgi:hypothetical protein